MHKVAEFFIRWGLTSVLIFVTFMFGFWQGSIGFNELNYHDSSIDKDSLFDSYTGFYNYGGYYCVWTEGRHYRNIEKTENHEICHHLINTDADGHFCTGDE